MKVKKGLQKVTETQFNVEWILGLKKVSYSDLRLLQTDDYKKVCDIMTHNINNLKGVELDKFLEQFNDVLNETTKNQMWENNHLLITQFINNYINEGGLMPNKTCIAQETKLSRKTVHKHFAEYAQSIVYKEQSEQFKIMNDRIMAVIFKEALKGNTKACRLFFEMTGGISKRHQREANTNNYIQINNTILNDEVVRGLNEKQLSQIEKIIIGPKGFQKT